jgi:hypothetical protein
MPAIISAEPFAQAIIRFAEGTSLLVTEIESASEISCAEEVDSAHPVVRSPKVMQVTIVISFLRMS